jgi:hypothetical protein
MGGGAEKPSLDKIARFDFKIRRVENIKLVYIGS